MPNGSMLCSLGKGVTVYVAAEDLSGNSSALITRRSITLQKIPVMPMQDVLDKVYELLTTHWQSSKYLWNFAYVKKWANQPASRAQKSLIFKLVREKKRTDLEKTIAKAVDDYDLNKYEASVLIGQLIEQ